MLVIVEVFNVMLLENLVLMHLVETVGSRLVAHDIEKIGKGLRH